MATLTIHSRLDGFQLLETLIEVTPKAIGGTGCFGQATVFILLEAMGQLAAMHVRHLVRFERHAFLLKIACAKMPAFEFSAGRYRLMAELANQSSHTFGYHVLSQGPGSERLTAELLIGTQAYDDMFQKRHLQAHYESRFNRINRGGDRAL